MAKIVSFRNYGEISLKWQILKLEEGEQEEEEEVGCEKDAVRGNQKK